MQATRHDDDDDDVDDVDGVDGICFLFPVTDTLR